jgi:hypothetical protein
MRDLDLEDYWAHAGFAERARERWVSPMPDPSVRRFIEEKRLPRWTLEPDPPRLEENLVTLTASDFFTLLYEAAESHW